jgi:hypothetical protein
MLPWVDEFRPVHNLASLAQVGEALGRSTPGSGARGRSLR